MRQANSTKATNAFLSKTLSEYFCLSTDFCFFFFYQISQKFVEKYICSYNQHATCLWSGTCEIELLRNATRVWILLRLKILRTLQVVERMQTGYSSETLKPKLMKGERTFAQQSSHPKKQKKKRKPKIFLTRDWTLVGGGRPTHSIYTYSQKRAMPLPPYASILPMGVCAYGGGRPALVEVYLRRTHIISLHIFNEFFPSHLYISPKLNHALSL